MSETNESLSVADKGMKSRFPRRTLLALLGFCALAASFSIYQHYLHQKEEEASAPQQEKGPTTPSFNGASNQLAHTVFVPVLQTPIPQGKSAVWCAGLALAWKELEKTAKGPVLLPNAPELAAYLKTEAGKPLGLGAKDYYAAAGFSWDGIHKRICEELTKKFPQAPLPAEPPEPSVQAYAYFEVTMKYVQAFLQETDPFYFRDSAGAKSNVHAFGIRTKDKHRVGTFRSQVVPYFHDGQGHYAVDLSSGMMPYQVIVACLDRNNTLAALLDQLNQRIANGPRPEGFGDEGILLVPNMDWQAKHEFGELQGQPIRAEGWPEHGVVVRSEQLLRFRMNREGVHAAATVDVSNLLDGDEPHHQGHYIFDRPYLVLLRKRGEANPFFVVWIDNAELLYKR